MNDLLASIAVDLEGNLAPLYSAMNAGVAYAARAGAQTGSAFMRGMQNPIFQAVGAYRMLGYEIQQTIEIASGISGVGLAADYQRVNVSMTQLLGSQEKANALIGEVQKLGETTPFNTFELLDQAKYLLAVGVAAKDVTRDMRVLTDAGAAMGLTTDGVKHLAKALGDVQAGGLKAQEMNQFANAGVNITDAINRGAGQKFTDKHVAAEYLRQFDTSKQVEIITKGLEMRFGGMAQTLGLGTVTGVYQNLGEVFQRIMLPTGNLLIPVVTLAGKILLDLVTTVAKLNEMTGGGAGLVGLLALTVVGVRQSVVWYQTAIGSINSLSTSLQRLAVTSAEATIATNTQSMANALSGGNGGFNLGKLKIGKGASLGEGIGNIGNFLNKGKGFVTGGGMLKMLGTGLNLAKGAAGFGLPIIGDLLGGAMEQSKNPYVSGGGSFVKNVASFAGVGAMIGSIIPGLGTALGAGIGALVGAVKGGIEAGQTIGNAGKTPAEKSADKMDSAANKMLEASKMKAEHWGGGPRMGNIANALSFEYAAMKGI
jgi:hypothetical protein